MVLCERPQMLPLERHDRFCLTQKGPVVCQVRGLALQSLRCTYKSLPRPLTHSPMPSSIAPQAVEQTGTKYMEKKQNRETFITAIVHLWASGEGNSSARIAEEAGRRGRPVSDVTVRKILGQWEADGRARMAMSGGGRGGGATYWLNPHNAPEEATLRTVVTYALSPNGLAESRQRTLKTAIRTTFKLQEKSEGERLLGPCATVTAAELYDFPERVHVAAMAAGVKPAVAANLRSAVRAAMRKAAEAGVVPIIFPKAFADDVWERAAVTYFPTTLCENGALNGRVQPKTIRLYRCHWRALATAVKEIVGPDATPDDLTDSLVAKLRGHLESQGKGSAASQLNTILSFIGREYHEGPQAGKWDGATETYNGRMKGGYLVDAKGCAHTGSPEGFLTILRDNGYGEEWVEYFEYYFLWVTLGEDAIESAPERFPHRAEIRCLSPSSVMKRLIGLRAWLFQAPIALNAPASTLTLERVFGSDYRVILKSTTRWWAKRAEAGEISDATSAGLVDIIKASLMIARSLQERLVNGRGGDVVGADGKALRNNVVEGSQQSAAEGIYWRAYTMGRAEMDKLESKRGLSGDGHVHNTIKDIKRIVKATPLGYWVQMLAELLRRIEWARTHDRGHTQAYHRDVLVAMVLGILLSTGARLSELCHIRLGTAVFPHDEPGQYPASSQGGGARLLRWRAVDRKNRRVHTAHLREGFCPSWLEAEWMRSRSFFMRNVQGGATAHDWLLVDTKGRPYGFVGETPTGSNRKDPALAAAFAKGKSRLRSAWKARLKRIAAALDLPIPQKRGEFAPHVIRCAVAHALYHDPRYGRMAASNFLGDRLGTVDGVYAEVDGAQIDATLVVPFIGLATDRLLSAEPAAPATRVADFAESLADLIAARREGHIDAAELQEAKRALRTRHGLAAA